MLTGDRISWLKKRANAIIKRTPVQVNEIKTQSLPESGGIYLISLIYDKQELPLYINNTYNLQSHTELLQVVNEVLIREKNLVWLKLLKPEMLNKQKATEFLKQNLYIRYEPEQDVKEQMALVVMVTSLLKPMYVTN